MDLVTVYDEDYAEVSCVNNFKAKKKKISSCLGYSQSLLNNFEM